METEQLAKGLKLMQEALGLLSSGPFDYTLKCLLAARETLLTKYAPFKVGDRVELVATPTINEDTAFGWMSAKHFLVRGAVGTVRESDVRSNGTLAFHVEFDDESWVDRDGVRRPVESKHVYCFGEKSLARHEPPNVRVNPPA
jgi:hypothetical protein